MVQHFCTCDGDHCAPLTSDRQTTSQPTPCICIADISRKSDNRAKVAPQFCSRLEQWKERFCSVCNDKDYCAFPPDGQAISPRKCLCDTENRICLASETSIADLPQLLSTPRTKRQTPEKVR